MSETIKIVFSVDNNFIVQFAVCLTSILINSNKEDKFQFYVLSADIKESDLERIYELKKIKDFELSLVSIDESLFSNCPISEHIQVPTYFRFLIPEIFSDDKILYLDTDLLVLDSLSELYATPLEDNYCAAVLNVLDSLYKHKIKIDKYFNAGVMLLNLKKLREDNIKEKCFDFVNQNKSKIIFWDQCVLNHLFVGKVKFLDCEWNFQWGNDYIKKRYKKYKKILKIIHFTSGNKPWKFKVCPRWIFAYYGYLIKTSYKKQAYKDIVRDIRKACNQCVKNLFTTIKVLKILGDL